MIPTHYDCLFSEEIICPWCGYQYADSREFFSSEDCGETEINCESCGKIIEVCQNVEVTYSAYKKEIPNDQI